jgi:hypothetical protein
LDMEDLARGIELELTKWALVLLILLLLFICYLSVIDV